MVAAFCLISRAVVLVNPCANDWGLSFESPIAYFAPELGCIMASLFPALLQILTMLIDHCWAVWVLALWEPSSTDPSAYRSAPKTAVASCLALGDTLANLFHHGLIACQPPFPLLLLCTLHPRKRPGSLGRRSNGGSGGLRLLARSPRRLCQQTMVWHQGADESLAQVVKQVPTVSDLYRPWRGLCCGCGIQAWTITPRNLGSGMAAQPLFSTLLASIRQ